MAIINGRHIDTSSIPDSGVYGRDILNETRPEPGRRVVLSLLEARLARQEGQSREGVEHSRPHEGLT